MAKDKKTKISNQEKKEPLIEKSILEEDLPMRDAKISFTHGDIKVDENDVEKDKYNARKLPREHSYETLALSDSRTNRKIRPAGFRSDGKMRKIKKNCLMWKIKDQFGKGKGKEKNPKLAVCITMYNEDVELLQRTLRGVLSNYNELRSDKDLNFKKKDFCVFLICDGFDKIKKEFLEFAIRKEFFQIEALVKLGFTAKVDMTAKKKGEEDEGYIKMKPMNEIMDQNIKGKIPSNIIHMFQVQTWDFGLDDKILESRRINFFFAIKQRNDGKINSHKWFFQGLCKFLKPQLCMMLDIGTEPDKHSIYKLYKYMTRHDQCGGCCGEIEVDFSHKDSNGGLGTFLIRAAQFFEYKTGHAPDKANESFFGFNSVLPGAYSMFRWKAIKGDPLDEFFKGVNSQEQPSCAEANEFLAEDRIMCLQIYIKRKSKYHLCYIPDAKARTDAPESLEVLIKQRRRWMNGATFGTTKVFSHFVDMVSCNRTKHSVCRQFGMVFFLIYYMLTFLSQFFTVGAMYSTISVFLKTVFKSMLEDMNASTLVVTLVTSLFDYIYIFLVLMTIIISLTVPVKQGIFYFKFLMVTFGLLLIITMIGILIYLIQTSFWPEKKEYDEVNSVWVGTGTQCFSTLVLCGTIMMSVYLLPMILRPLDFLINFRLYIIGMFCYIFMMPTFINVMAIYSMCNLHDISWGNRPSNSQGIEAVAVNAAEQAKLKLDYQEFRAHSVYMWLVLNLLYGGLSSTLTTGGESKVMNDGSIGFLEGYSIFVASLVVFKFIFAAIYNIKWNIRVCRDSYYRASKVDFELNYKEVYNQEHSSEDEENPNKKLVDQLAMDLGQEAQNGKRQTHTEAFDSDNDDKDFADIREDEMHDMFQQSMMRNRFISTTLVKVGGGDKGMSNRFSKEISYQKREFNQMKIIESVSEYDHDDPSPGDRPNDNQFAPSRNNLGALGGNKKFEEDKKQEKKSFGKDKSKSVKIIKNKK